MARDLQLGITTPADVSGIDKTVRHLDRLDRQLEETSRSAAELRREFAKTGDLELLPKIVKAEALEARLKRIRRQLDDVGDEATEAARKVAMVGGGGLFGSGGLFGAAVGSPLTAGLVGGAVAASPLIAAAVSGAVLAGLGSGVVAGGIVAAFRDAQVQTAGKGLVAELGADFRSIGLGFKDETLDAIGKIRAAWRADLRPEITATMTAAEKLVDPLTEAVIGFTRGALPGFRHAVEEAGPVFDTLKFKADDLGRAVGGVFARMGDEAEGGAQGLEDLLTLTEMSLGATGGILGALTSAWETYRKDFGGPLPLMIADLAKGSDDLSGTLTKVEDSAEGVAGGFADAVQAAEKLRDTLDDLMGDQLSLDAATINFKQDLLGLRDALDENGRAFDEHSEAGLANRDVMQQMVESADRVRRARIEEAGGTEEAVRRANAAFQGEIAAIRAVGVAAGLAGKDLDAFLARYLQITRAPNVTKSVTIKYVSDLSQFAPPASKAGQLLFYAQGGIHHAASGLFTGGGFLTQPTIIAGERGTGRELFLPEKGISRGRAMSLLAEGAAMHGASVVPAEAMRNGFAHAPVPPYSAGRTETIRIEVVVKEPDGRVLEEKLIERAFETGRTPAQLWPDQR